MKLQLRKFFYSQIAYRAIAVLVFCYIQLLYRTCKIEHKIDREADKLFSSNAFIMTFWHSRILMMPKMMSRYKGNFAAVVSSHGDGGALEKVLNIFGHGTIRGSSKKDALKALKGVFEYLKNNRGIAITPDGPRGPRYKIGGNIVKIAAHTKTPVVPACFSCDSAWVLNSWDRFVIPKPFSKIIVEVLKPINISSSSDEENEVQNLENVLLSHMKKLDNQMNLKVDY